jgi:hypothetical protein
MEDKLVVRQAESSDAPLVAAIFAHYVINTSGTTGWVRISEFSSREENIGGEQLRICDQVAAISAD